MRNARSFLTVLFLVGSYGRIAGHRSRLKPGANIDLGTGDPSAKSTTFVRDHGLRMDALLTAPHQGDKNEQDYNFYNRCFSSR